MNTILKIAGAGILLYFGAKWIKGRNATITIPGVVTLPIKSIYNDPEAIRILALIVENMVKNGNEARIGLLTAIRNQNRNWTAAADKSPWGKNGEYLYTNYTIDAILEYVTRTFPTKNL